MNPAGRKYIFLVPWITFILVFSYAVVRHVILKGAGIDQVFWHVLNKAIALTAVIIIGSSFLSRDNVAKKFLGVAGLAFVLLHIALSGFLFFPAISGLEPAILCGMLAALGFLSVTLLHKRVFIYLALLLVIGHVAIMGYKNWINLQDWRGHLPPITLLAAVFIVYVLAKKVGKKLLSPIDRSRHRVKINDRNS